MAKLPSPSSYKNLILSPQGDATTSVIGSTVGGGEVVGSDAGSVIGSDIMNQNEHHDERMTTLSKPRSNLRLQENNVNSNAKQNKQQNEENTMSAEDSNNDQSDQSQSNQNQNIHNVNEKENNILPNQPTPEEQPAPRIIHILETRFMQNQPNLIQLAKARLELFRAICLPTVLHQSAWGNFLWVIRTDPDLDESVKKELVEILEKSEALVQVEKGRERGDDDENNSSSSNNEKALTYVIGSNINYIMANVTSPLPPNARPFDIQHMLSSVISDPSSLFAGKLSHIEKLLKEITSETMEKDIVLWTRLDADDGLNNGYLEYVQSQAVRYFLPEYYAADENNDGDGAGNGGNEKKGDRTTHQNNGNREENGKGGKDAAVGSGENSGLTQQNNGKENKEEKVDYIPPQWTYWCAGRNIDWFLDPHLKNGTVYPVQHTNVCVTPGVTIALKGSTDPAQVPRLDHDKIISYLRPNQQVNNNSSQQEESLCGRKGISIIDTPNDDTDDSLKEEKDDGTCFHMINAFPFSAVRSRTPTSAGMLGVSPSLSQMEMVKRQKMLQRFMWLTFRPHFGIGNKGLVRTNRYFRDMVYEIAEENGRGQCTEGHSCKTSSKDLLQQYVDLKTEIIEGFEIGQHGRIMTDN